MHRRYLDLNTKDLDVYAVFIHLFILVAATSGQNCSDIVGSPINIYNDSDYPVYAGRTFILADQQYTVPCKGKVVAWKFCYRYQFRNTTTAVTFTASIWRNNSNNTYKQVDSSVIKFIPNRTDSSVSPCQKFYLSREDQFIAPVGSVVGFYSNTGAIQSLLLYADSNITTYMFIGNDTQYQIINSQILNYTIAINVYLDVAFSRGAAGIIIGSICGFIVSIILLILLPLLLFHKQKKLNIGAKRRRNFDATSHEYFELESRHHSVEPTDQIALLSSNGSINYKSIQPVTTGFLQQNTIGKDSATKFPCGDYIALQSPHYYTTAEEMYSKLEKSVTYDYARPMGYSEVSVSIEESYLDPGHSKADIYACFDRKKFHIIKNKDVSILQKIGSGEFGTVHHGLWTSDSAADPVQVAVKTLNLQCSESDKVKFLREAAIMGQFEDEYIVRLHGVVTEVPNAMIVLELMPKGDLREFLIDIKEIYNTYPEELCQLKQSLLSFCRHISAGLNHLSYKGFVHRDLAARNILVSSDDVCKIGDFGMARDVADDSYYIIKGGKIPVKWTAPEAIFYRRYSVQSDVWSYGCVMYEIWSLGHKPFEDDDGREYIDKISAGFRLPPPPGCPRSIYELMIQCWHPIANHRISSSEIVRILASNRILLTAAELDEEQSTVLGDPLDTSSQLYLDLQQTYLSEIQ